MKNILYVVLGITILTTVLVIGTPFDFLNSTVDTLATFIFILFDVVFFIILFRLARRIEKKKIKWFTIGLLTLLSIPYLWTCLLDINDYKWKLSPDVARHFYLHE